MDIFGSNISAHGEHSGRGRRKLIANYPYVKDGENRIRVSFHIKGEKATGKALAEVINKEGTWQFRFLTTETDSYPKQSVVLIDNRF